MILINNINSLNAIAVIIYKIDLQSKSIYWYLYDGNFGV